MSDENEKKRPNAGYQLSKTSATPHEITYHYNRESRLENAPQRVQDLYNAGATPRRRLARVAAGGKIQLFTMIAILLVSALALITTIIGRDDYTHDLEGNMVTVQAIRYEELVIVAMRKIARSRNTFLTLRVPRPAYVGPVSIDVSPAGDPAAMPAPAEYAPPLGNIFFTRVNFTEESPEFFRFTVPFDAEELDIVLRTEARDLYIRVRVE